MSHWFYKRAHTVCVLFVITYIDICAQTMGITGRGLLKFARTIGQVDALCMHQLKENLYIFIFMLIFVMHFYIFVILETKVFLLITVILAAPRTSKLAPEKFFF